SAPGLPSPSAVGAAPVFLPLLMHPHLHGLVRHDDGGQLRALDGAPEDLRRAAARRARQLRQALLLRHRPPERAARGIDPDRPSVHVVLLLTQDKKKRALGLGGRRALPPPEVPSARQVLRHWHECRSPYHSAVPRLVKHNACSWSRLRRRQPT